PRPNQGAVADDLMDLDRSIRERGHEHGMAELGPLEPARKSRRCVVVLHVGRDELVEAGKIIAGPSLFHFANDFLGFGHGVSPSNAAEKSCGFYTNDDRPGPLIDSSSEKKTAGKAASRRRASSAWRPRTRNPRAPCPPLARAGSVSGRDARAGCTRGGCPPPRKGRGRACQAESAG